MATVQKRGKKWYAIFVDSTGKQRWKAAYSDKAPSLRFARQEEDKARHIKLGDFDPQESVHRIERGKLINVHIEEYKASMQAAGCSDNHVSYTIADIQKLVDFGGNITTAAAITKPLVDRWVNSLKTAKVDANKTINRRVGSVQQFLKHLHKIKGLTEYPLYQYPQLETEGFAKRISRSLSLKERDTLLSDKTYPERHALYLFASKTGLRMNEIRQMVPTYFDFKHKQINIPAHVAKAKKPQRIPLHPELLPLVKALCEDRPDDAPVFHVPSKQTVNNNLRADLTRLGIKLKNVSFHSLRHTFCTLLVNANVHPALLKTLARHSDLKTTLKYYVHLQRSDESEAIAKI